ncbi:MAG: diacylglycerol kinase family lipid kinase [Streptococcaceae bacterium]|jgi:YegS/Rv2252/BmrU family lipid kinase|nr:diacylglycerol kinase family lipid kinase [Streptococcaceae bacterium]
MTYLILANPNSGSKRGTSVVSELVTHFTAAHIDYKLFLTAKKGDETLKMKELLAVKDEFDRVLIIGGDGTLSLAMNVLPEEMPFSYIPAGSGNDFARAMGISKDPLTAFTKLHDHPETKDIFVIRYETAHQHGIAMNNIGIGLDAAIIEESERGHLKKALNTLKVGSLFYLISGLNQLFTKKAFAARVSDVANFEKAFLFTTTKHPYFGGGVTIAPDATNSKPELYLCEVDKIPKRRMFQLLGKIVKGTQVGDSEFHQHIAGHFEVTIDQDEPMQIDGELHYLTAHDTLKMTNAKRQIIF